MGMAFTSFILLVFPWKSVAESAQGAAEGFQERQLERMGLSYWTKRVARVNYEEAEPGDIVSWCVDRSYGSDITYLSGRPSQPLLWTNLSEVPQGSPTSGGRCAIVLARVVERRAQGLLLTFLGKP